MWSVLIIKEGKPAVPFRHLVLSCPLTDQLTLNKQQRSPLSERGQGNSLSDARVEGNS